MIYVIATTKVKPGQRDAYIAGHKKCIAETHKEKGCHAYAFSEDFADPTLVRLFELWESEADLHAHFVTPHMAKFQAAIGSIKPRDFDVKRYEISKVGPVR